MLGWSMFRKRQSGFSPAYIVLGLVIIGSICLIGFLVVASQPGADNALVPLDGPESGTAEPQPTAPDDGVPDNFSTFADAQLGFSLSYPQDWGDLQPKPGSKAVLEMMTPLIKRYSLAGSMEVKVTKLADFRIRANDLNTIVQPVPNGGGYDWIITDKGSGRQAIGKPVTPAPSVIYRSGKTQVYSFLATEANCTYNMWAFPAGANFVRLRLPSFCISSKPGDADVQADHKADFDRQKDLILKSITVQ